MRHLARVVRWGGEGIVVVALVVGFIVLSGVLAVVTLRSTTVLQQVQRSAAADREAIAAAASAVSAHQFDRAMTAMARAVERVQEGQIEVLGRVVDMVAGPQNGGEGGQAPEVDPLTEMRAPWSPDDDREMIYADPTDAYTPDEWLKSEDAAIEPADQNPARAVSVRPGEGLL